MKKKPSDITKQSEGAGGIKWAKELFEQEIKPNVAGQPVSTIKLVRKIWNDAFVEGQRYRETQIIEFLEQRLKDKDYKSHEWIECNQILNFVKGFSLYHED